MKNFLFTLLAATIVQNSAQACPDFSGQYELSGSTTEVVVTVTQNACTDIRFDYYYPASGGRASQAYTADDKVRVTMEDQNQTVSQSSKFTDSTLVNTVTFMNKATQKTTSAVSTYHQDAAGGFVGIDQYYNSSGTNYASGTRAFNKAQ